MPNDSQHGKNRGIIHLIDDEKDIVAFAASVLERQGYQVHFFTSISELLKDAQVCGENMSLLITDIRMPEGSGFEVARKVRAIKKDIPIIFMTAFEINSSEFLKIFPSLKVDAFLQKPFHISELFKLIEKHS